MEYTQEHDDDFTMRYWTGSVWDFDEDEEEDDEWPIYDT